MSDVAFTYRAIWPIEDPRARTRDLIAEAQTELDVMATADEARIVGKPAWTRTGDRLVCEAPAEPAPLPPLPDVDEAKVYRACRGERIPLSSAELYAAVTTLRRENPELTLKEIAQRLHRKSSSLSSFLLKEQARREAASCPTS